MGFIIIIIIIIIIKLWRSNSIAEMLNSFSNETELSLGRHVTEVNEYFKFLSETDKNFVFEKKKTHQHCTAIKAL